MISKNNFYFLMDTNDNLYKGRSLYSDTANINTEKLKTS